MHNDYSLQKLAEMRHRDDLAAAEAWRLASQAAPARPKALRIGRHGLARLEARLERLGCTLRALYQELRAVPGEARCAC